ncbi:MAG: hypothetical protein MK194_13030 [Roseibacillus sp.]|nr:hypothetical protein [Roseibacillus sp.]
MELSFPITQIALDYATTAEALEMASPAVEAGFDWLEVGRPHSPCRGSEGQLPSPTLIFPI